MPASDEVRDDPVVAQRRLRTTLRRLRLRPEAQKTQREVAQALDWSPSKLLRIEGGQVPIATSDLIALLTYYGITAKEESDELVELARVSRKRTIRDTYQDVFSKEFAEFIQHEAYASSIRQFETKLVPGQLQTEAYAEAVIRAYLGPNGTEGDVNRRVQARLERSSYLFGRHDGGPDMSFIIDESVIQRRVGVESKNRSLMLEQLERLKELNSKPNISIQVVPFGLGMYGALRGPFELIEFEDPADSALLYLENPQGDALVHEDDDEISPYIDMFSDLDKLLTKNRIITFEDKITNVIRSIDNETSNS
jgi:transcriptional regulator with XRE-family HTH domain